MDKKILAKEFWVKINPHIRNPGWEQQSEWVGPFRSWEKADDWVRRHRRRSHVFAIVEKN